MLDVKDVSPATTTSARDWRPRAVSAADALAAVSSGATIFVHGAAATPISFRSSSTTFRLCSPADSS
jgi:hypothetical protein